MSTVGIAPSTHPEMSETWRPALATYPPSARHALHRFHYAMKREHEPPQLRQCIIRRLLHLYPGASAQDKTAPLSWRPVPPQIKSDPGPAAYY